jgi:hypothetical protein
VTETMITSNRAAPKPISTFFQVFIVTIIKSLRPFCW